MSQKKVAILQSNYIPWKGYFDLIAAVDEFIFYDEMQYTERDWRNRNKIKVGGSGDGTKWLSIPVNSAGFQTAGLKIREIKIAEPMWAKKHWHTLIGAYAKTPYFKEYRELFSAAYQASGEAIFLSEVNYRFIKIINELLGITTKITQDRDYGIIDGKTERLVDLCKKAGASEYISGPAARDYIDEKLFANANIKLTWFDYADYPEYPQLHPPFTHYVSILDLLFNCGADAKKYMKDFGDN